MISLTGGKQTSQSLPKKLKSKLEQETMQDIQHQVEACLENSPFLQSQAAASATQVTLFDRRQVQLGVHLGEGTFSDVYQVARFKISPTEQTSYAIKIPKNGGHGRRQSLSFFGRRNSRSSNHGSSGNFQDYARACMDLILEGKYLAAMDHPNIIKVRGLSAGPSPFLIMDRLCDTLDQRIEQWRQANADPLSLSASSRSTSTRRSKPLPKRWKTMGGSFRLTRPKADLSMDCSLSSSSVMPQLEDRAGYALEIAQALQYLHKHRIILRDLKPSNVGFIRDPETGNEVVKLFDFGLCRELPQANDDDHHQEFRMSIAGTTRYMAVEILNSGVYGLKADIYSWAITSYEVLTLERPYAAVCATPELHKRFVCREGVRPVFGSHKQDGPWVPFALQKLIQAAWAQHPRDRPSACHLSSQLQTLIQNDFHTTPVANSNATSPNSQVTLMDALAMAPPRHPSPMPCSA